ncbi:MAG: ClpXP protease specificity-enhancing factor SspB [Sphingomonadales bacterium]
MTDTTPDSLIPYDDIVQDALRGVVSRVLQRIADEGGLPGGHHFYIAFRTRAPGVSIPRHLMERYPDEMTIVIQHRYWDLVVAPDHFSIGLSFNQMPAQLVVPYDAIVGFVDPAVNFALQFAPKDGEAPPEGPDEPPEAPPPAPEDGGSNVVTLDRFRRK